MIASFKFLTEVGCIAVLYIEINKEALSVIALNTGDDATFRDHSCSIVAANAPLCIIFLDGGLVDGVHNQCTLHVVAVVAAHDKQLFLVHGAQQGELPWLQAWERDHCPLDPTSSVVQSLNRVEVPVMSEPLFVASRGVKVAIKLTCGVHATRLIELWPVSKALSCEIEPI